MQHPNVLIYYTMEPADICVVVLASIYSINSALNLHLLT